jgi:hypothetical protein
VIAFAPDRVNAIDMLLRIIQVHRGDGHRTVLGTRCSGLRTPDHIPPLQSLVDGTSLRWSAVA